MKQVALFIGIDEYQDDANIAKLNYAENDAREMRWLFEEKAGLSDIDLIVGKQASLNEITRKIREFKEILKSGDLFMIYFAGHGFEHKDKGPSLMTYDFNSEDHKVGLESALLPVHTLDQLTRKTGVERLVIVDACRGPLYVGQKSGMVSQGAGLARAFRLKQKPSDQQDYGSFNLLSSCREGECSYELKEIRSGAFTGALVHVCKEHLRSGNSLLLPRDQDKIVEATRSYLKQHGKTGVQTPECVVNREVLLVNGKKHKVEPQSIQPPLRFPKKASWFYHKGNKHHGPFLLSELTHLLEDGVINEQAFVWKEGMTDWLALREVQELKKHIPGIAVPPRLRINKPHSLKNRAFPLINLDRVWINPGRFMMGSPKTERNRIDDELQHEVALTKGFWMGKYAVTQQQWKFVMGDNPSIFKGADRPVENINWHRSMEFCQRLTTLEKKAGRLKGGLRYTLPTEEQWEYVCRAGTKSAFSYGNSLGSHMANFNGNCPYGGASTGPDRGETTAIGSFPANAWGLHDMHGNVWEWCLDWYKKSVGGSPRGYRVVRGGAWGCDARDCRSASRGWRDPSDAGCTLGFRIVLTMSP